MKINNIMRAAWVKRWGIVRTMREQNIAEHSFTVAMISEELCKRVGWEFDEGGSMHGIRGLEVLRWALWHDMAEVFTGDIPTPTKLKLKESDPELLQKIEDEFAPDIAALRKNTNRLWIEIVKVADYLEAIAFLEREGGNQEAEDVKTLLRKQLIEYISDWNSMLRVHKKEIYSLADDMGIPIG